MFICQFTSVLLLLAPAFGFLSHFETYDQLYPRHAPQLHTHLEDALPYSFQNRVAVRSLKALTRRQPTQPSDPRMAEVTTNTAGHSENDATPRTDTNNTPRGAMKKPGSVPNLQRKVSWAGDLVAGANAEHPSEASLRHFSHTLSASGDISKMITKADQVMEESSNPEVKLAGVGLAAVGDGGKIFKGIITGVGASGKGKGLLGDLAHEAEKVEEHIHLGGSRYKHAGGERTYRTGLGATDRARTPANGRGNPRFRPGTAGKSRTYTNGEAPSPGRASGAGRGQPTGNHQEEPKPQPQANHEKAESDSGSHAHSSDEENTDVESHQDPAAAIGQVRGKGLRPRPVDQDAKGGGTAGRGGGSNKLPPQSVVGRKTRYNGLRVGRPLKVKRPPKKFKSTKPWNAYGLGLTAVGVAIAGGAIIPGTIAAEKGAEAAAKGADASQLGAQAGMKGADAAQVGAQAGIQNAHAVTSIAESVVKSANASKEGADGTYLIGAVNYQTAAHKGVNVTAAKQMEQHAAKTNSKRKRSYPPVILHYDW